MFLDASAIVAILVREPGHDVLIDRLEVATRLMTSGVAVIEAVLALHRIDRVPITAANEAVKNFLAKANVVLVPLADAETRVAVAAYAQFGKGQGHPARLNLGDCFAYACARTHDVPLLFVGEDFARTDIRSAMT